MTQQHDTPEGGALTLELMADRLTQYLHNDVADGTPIADIAHDVVSHMLTGKYGGPSRRAAVADILNRFSAKLSTPIQSVALSPDYIMKSMMAGSATAPTPPAPAGLVDAVRAYREAEQGFDEGRVSPHQLAQARSTLDATLSGQQGGAVPAGDLRPGPVVDPAPHAAASVVPTGRHGTLSMGYSSFDGTYHGPLPRLAEQPAPAGTGDADRVEGLRPGIERAIAIVEVERETVSISSPAYQRLSSVYRALRDALDGASDQGEG